MKRLITEYFNELSVHGLSHIVKPKIQWLERLLWFIVVANATYYSVEICLDQWDRYISNPVALLADRRYQNLKIPTVATTICGYFTDEERIQQYIERKINLKPGDQKFDYYHKFLSVLSNVNYSTPSNELEEFKQDKFIEGLDLLNVVLEVNNRLLAKMNNSNNYKNDDDDKNYAVMTESGLCLTNSKLHGYQNPFGENLLEKDSYSECYGLYTCTSTISIPFSGHSGISFFFHDRLDIMALKTRASLEKRGTSAAGKFTLNVGIVQADNAVRQIPPKNRKCLFKDENLLSYFQVYTQSLCFVECRIKASIKSCGCRPFFYVVGDGPVCNVSGMMCALSTLQSFNETACDCLEGCESLIYTGRPFLSLGLSQFKSDVIVEVIMPNVVYTKRVIFSADELLVSFGGTVSLFLGCSILTCVEIIFFMAEVVCKLLRYLCLVLYVNSQ